MSSFAIAYEIVKKNEGGYANNPKDKGGETYAGIARNFNPDWKGWTYIDFKKRTTFLNKKIPNNAKFPDIQYLVDEFYENLWKHHRLKEIENQEVTNLLFDYIVNSGNTAIKGVQEILGLKEDGILGSKTITGINNNNGYWIYNNLLKHREQHYKNLIVKDPSQKEFEDTWNDRIKGFTAMSAGSTNIILLIIIILIFSKLWTN